MKFPTAIILAACLTAISHAGSGGGRIGSKVKIHSGTFGEFEKEYSNNQVAWEIESTKCGLETAIVQVWVRKDSTDMWEAPEWYISDCKIRVIGDKRRWTPGPWIGWEYMIKVLR